MAGTATVNVAVTISGGIAGQVNDQYVWTNTSANELVTAQACGVGANTVNVPTLPTQAIGVVIIPPSTNTNAITLKGVTGDTGIAISPNTPTLLTFATVPPASFVLTIATATTEIGFRWI